MYDTAPTLTTPKSYNFVYETGPILFQVLCDHVLSKKTPHIKRMLAEWWANNVNDRPNYKITNYKMLNGNNSLWPWLQSMQFSVFAVGNIPFLYYRNMPVLKLNFNPPHFTPKNLPCPFFYYTSPTKKTLFKTGKILPKAYLEGYYGQFHSVGRTFRTLILCLVPQLGMRIILSCCYFIHTSSLYHVGHLNILCHSHISAMSQYKGGVGRTQTNWYFVK